jgi:RecA-family ATPase
MMMSTSQTSLPAPLETEQALLGALLLDSIALPAARILRPYDFSNPSHAIIFAVICQLEADGLPITPQTLTTRLERTGMLERAGGSSYIASLPMAAPAVPSIPTYVKLLRQHTASRQRGDTVGDSSVGGSPPLQPAAKIAEPIAPRNYRRPDTLGALSPEEARARLATLAPDLQSIQTLLSRQFSPTRWIIPNLLPEGLTLLASKPKLGKSWLALGLALAVASGGQTLGQITVEPGAALYLALEDSEKRLHARTQQLLGGQPLSSSLEVTTRWPRLDAGGLAQIELWLQAKPDARLIILDTLAKIRGHTRGSATPYAEDYASLEGVQALAHRYEVGILVIHHTGKESREDPLDEVNATQGLNGVADNILVLRRQRGKAEATLIGDGRELNGIELSLHFDPATCLWTITDPPEAEAKTPERAEILQVLKASQEPMTPTQVAEALGKNLNTIKTLLTRMFRAEEVKLIAYGRYTTVNSVNPVNPVNPVNLVNAEKASSL